MVGGYSTSPTLITPKMEVIDLNREESQNFINTYHTIYGRDPSDVEVNDHLTSGAQSMGVSWLKHFDIFRDYEIPLK